MNILQELLVLSEAKEKNLIGLMISNKLITDKTKDEPWHGKFAAPHLGLTSLEGAPSSVGGYFDVFGNQLTSLKFGPRKVGANFVVTKNKLTSLEFAPETVDGSFGCSHNQLTSLKDIHKILKKVNGTFYADHNPIKSHVLGLLLIPGCEEVTLENRDVQAILNKYLPNTRGNKALLECQSELLDAGFEDFAQL